MIVGVLLSVGRHPTAHRERVCHADLAALRVALASGERVIGLHLGQAHDVLRDYGAYGLTELICMDPGARQESGTAALQRSVRAHGIRLLVAGNLGENPGATGLLPYRLAHTLGWPIWPACVSLTRIAHQWQATLRLDAQTRRRQTVADGAMLVAAAQGIEDMVYAATRRDRMRLLDDGGHVLPSAPPARLSAAAPPNTGGAAPSMPKPAWTRPDPRDNAAARLATLRGLRSSATGRILHELTPEQAVPHVLAFLEQYGLQTPPTHDEGCSPS